MKLNILHLSDLHFTAGNLSQDTVISSLSCKLKELNNTPQNPNIIVLTGDIAFSGKKEEYVKAKLFIDEISQNCGISKNRIYIIPGNHDIDRSKLDKASFNWFYKFKNESELNDILGNKEVMAQIQKGSEAFFDFMKEYMSEKICTSTNGEYISTIPFGDNGLRLTICGFNSAVFCGYDGDDNKKLAIGLNRVNACSEKIQSQNDLIISCIHHPFECFHPCDKPSLTLLERMSDIILLGHVHEANNYAHIGGNLGETILVTSGAGFEKRTSQNGFNIIEVDSSTLEVQIIFFKYLPNEHLWIRNKDINHKTDGVFNFQIKTGKIKPEFNKLEKIPVSNQLTNLDKHPIVTDFLKNNDLLITYKKEIEEKYSKIKLLDKDIHVKDIYVDLSYEPFPVTKKVLSKSCEELICKEQIKSESARKEFINIVILGLPGAGKSTLLKYMLYKYNQNENVIPIYVELKSDSAFKRNIIEHSDEVRMLNIRTYLEDYFEQVLTKEGESKKFLDFVSGKNEFIFFCDGLDEISPDEYVKFYKAINKIITLSKHRAIISSREIGFSANDYPNFKLYSLSDFDDNKQKEYIEKHFKTLDINETSRKNNLFKLLENNLTISRLAQSPILLYLLCITIDIKSIKNKAQLFKNAIKILLKNRQITIDEEQNRLIGFLQEVAVTFYKLDKLECFEKNELEFYAEKFFCENPDEICETLKGKYLECGLFVPFKDKTSYKFTHRTIWEYLVAEGMTNKDRDKNEIYSRTNMGLWEEPIKMYVTLVRPDEIEQVLSGIWKENKALSLSCMRELGDEFPDKIFSDLYANLSKRDKLRLIDTIRESYVNASSEYSKRIVKTIRDTLVLVDKAEAKVKDCEVIYSYISFLEEFENKESVFCELLTEFLDLKNAQTRRQRLCDDFGLCFIKISSGNFEMGRNPIQNEGQSNILFVDLEETPAHHVKISNDFLISRTLISNEMFYKSGFPYADVERLNNNPYSDQDKQPVNKVNWFEAIIFAKWLGCTLPTEAEWEYACVGAAQDRERYITPYSDKMKEVLDQVACYSANSDNKTREVLPIEESKTNSLGLLDMLGNLREWCSDWYSDDFYNLCRFDEKRYPNFKKDIEGKEKVSYDAQGKLLKDDYNVYNGDVYTFDNQKRCINPVKKQPGKFEAKCLRGGCFDWSYTNLRPTYRNHNPASNVYKVNGFRLVLKFDENVQSELKHKMIDEKILNENILLGIEEYTYNAAVITFDKENHRYHFNIEKHFTIKSDVIPSYYNSHIFANKFLFLDSHPSIEFYKTNPLLWDELNVQVSFCYQNIGDNDYLNEISNIKVEHRNIMNNAIHLKIYYETKDGEKIPLHNGARIKIKYRYSIPIKLWGNYMNRYVSYSNEPMFIELKFDKKIGLDWAIEEVLADGSKENMIEGSGYRKKEEDTRNTILEIRRSKPLAQYRIIWNAEEYFGIKGINTF